MDKEQFEKQAAKLDKWANGKGGRVFFINGYLGHAIKVKAGKIIITEADNGGINYSGEEIILTPGNVEVMEFNEEEYHFSIGMIDDTPHGGQGYDIEVYDLERIDFE